MPAMVEAGRPLRARIDRAAFQHNIDQAARRCPNANVLVVLKADAYGHGLVEMARGLDDRDVAVAGSDEARVLIESGYAGRIWVLEGPFNQDCLNLSRSHDVVWVIHALWQLELIAQNPDHEDLTVWLKLDTGMHRLGLNSSELAPALARLDTLKAVSLQGVMSHFAGSDEPENPAVFSQTQLFDQLLSQPALRRAQQSLANSGAVLFYPAAHRDWVRPGIMLYGGVPDRGACAADHGLQAVMTLQSRVMALRTVPGGDAVGYGARWQARRDSLIATVACGYGDGYPRHAPDGTPVAVNGQRVALAGRVSMDMITVDVTDLESVSIGDPVELWGPQISVDEVAELSGTISYELLTGVTARVPRVYV